MDNKLTLQDCFKYPNAKIVRFDSVLGVKIDTFYSIQDFIEESARYAIISDIEISNCKLILRDIGNLTKKEKDYIGKTMGLLSIISKDRIQLIDYLRRINVDIDEFLKYGKAVKND